MVDGERQSFLCVEDALFDERYVCLDRRKRIPVLLVGFCKKSYVTFEIIFESRFKFYRLSFDKIELQKQKVT